MEQAILNGTTLGTYLKKLVLALLADRPLLLIRFQEASRLHSHLVQEAQELEMPLDTYILALLADGDRSLYKSSLQPALLWYPHNYMNTLHQDDTNVKEGLEDDVNMEEAMQNVQEFFADMTGF